MVSKRHRSMACFLMVALFGTGCSSLVATESTGGGRSDNRIVDMGSLDISLSTAFDVYVGQVPDATVTLLDERIQSDLTPFDQGLGIDVVNRLTDTSVGQAPDVRLLDAARPSQTESSLDGQSGALVTRDCEYRTYPYAVDILLSCGDERFGQMLRLHTFKRHAHGHRRVYNDQLITYRDQRLWFDAYDIARCVTIDNRGRMGLSIEAARCARLDLVQNANGFLIRESSANRCAGLGTAQCDDHQFTGGRECGGVQHRYLPIVMGDCNSALQFRFEARADFCEGFLPEPACF
ncbi:MAG: hypothetical protein VYA30_02125 [Myxococcota bacterium]|nr:hypothetical protein [Myxococcota bacterium]